MPEHLANRYAPPWGHEVVGEEDMARVPVLLAVLLTFACARSPIRVQAALARCLAVPGERDARATHRHLQGAAFALRLRADVNVRYLGCVVQPTTLISASQGQCS
jgi:hypothetical protein